MAGVIESIEEAAKGEPIDLWEPYDPEAHHPTASYHDPAYRAKLQEQTYTTQCSSCHVYYGGPHRGRNPGQRMQTVEIPAEGYEGPFLTIPEGGISHGACPGCYTEHRRAYDEGAPRGSIIIG